MVTFIPLYLSEEIKINVERLSVCTKRIWG